MVHLGGSPVADGVSSHGRKGFSSELIGRSMRLGSHCLERKAAATMRDDQILSTPLILGYALHRSIQPGCWRTSAAYRRMFPTGSQSPVRAVRYSIKNPRSKSDGKPVTLFKNYEIVR